ncbi:MAG: ATP-dependent protease ATPase subunit HslU [Candidatus Bipolaricaulota bacterium]
MSELPVISEGEAKKEEFTPKRIVQELNNYIVGQEEAKRSVAIAIRNRIRRQHVQGQIKEEIQPKNILMIGPTGVGKTEISRRLAKIASSPFVKVEASKFTEVGYVGRDVESMVRDLVDAGIKMVREAEIERVEGEAKQLVEERILDNLLPSESKDRERAQSIDRTREKLRKKLRNGELDDRYIEIQVEESSTPQVEVFSQEGMDQMGIDMSDMLSNILPQSTETKRVKIKDAREIIFDQEVDKLLNQEEIRQRGRALAEETGIIFLDEIDKIAADDFEAGGGGSGPGVSRQGVQRDILPLLEGSSVRTRYGTISTENILFITAGAFTMSKPSDLIPELQGRLPIRVELNNLGSEEFKQILTQPKDALIKQYMALLEVEDITVEFTDDAIEEIAEVSAQLNEITENIGARRLQTVMEKLMEDISFDAPDMRGKQVTIDAQYVREKLEDTVEDRDLSRYIL